MRISTNILRDQDTAFDYIVTENTQYIYDHLEAAMAEDGGCFNLIGSYGTGKSSFLLALEQTLKGIHTHFHWTPPSNATFQFIKLVGQPESITRSLNKALDLRANTALDKTLDALVAWSKNASRSLLFADELGKFVEYALLHDPKKETYVFQRLAELINAPDNNLTWVGTLHQNIDGYAAGASRQDAAEWEKVSGRFQTLNFNEPATTLLKLCSAKLEQADYGADHKQIKRANTATHKSNLLPSAFITLAEDLAQNLRPFDALGAFFTISALQKYGQNERSVFSFLEARGPGSLEHPSGNFYTASDLHRYVGDRMSHVIFSPSNPDKLAWEAAERAIQRADSHSEIHPQHARLALHTVLLASIFGQDGAKFNQNSLKAYVSAALGKDAGEVVAQLVHKNIIQFLKYKGRLAFMEGTDVNLHAELREAGQHIPTETDLLHEAAERIALPARLNKSHFLKSGTPRFTHYSVSTPKNPKPTPNAPTNIACTILLDFEDIPELEPAAFPVLQVLVTDIEELKALTLDILRYEHISEKYADDLVVKHLVANERNHCLVGLQQALEQSLYSESTTWRFDELEYTNVTSETMANRVVSEVLDKTYDQAPKVLNELINQEKLSSSVNTSRKVLFRALLERSTAPQLGFNPDKFPAEKSIFLSTWDREKLYNWRTGQLKLPKKNSSYQNAWAVGEEFLAQAKGGKVSLSGLVNRLREAPFGMKQGLLNYWVPLFLMTKEDEFAHYCTPENKYLPYLSIDIFESIIRTPEHFAVKALNIQGVSQATLNQYRELAQIDPNRTSTQSTYLGIFANFISLQRSLNGYALRTKMLSPEAMALREAISEAPDPETALFDTIPAAIGHHHISTSENPEDIQEFFTQLTQSARELAGCYSELLGRLEISIRKGFQLPGGDFDALKSAIHSNLSGLEPELLAPRLKTLQQRLVSPLDDQESWVKSIGDAILGKSLEQLEDAKEPLLHQHIQEAIAALLAQKGIRNEGGDAIAVSMTLADGTRVERFVQSEELNASRKALLSKIESLSSQERLSLAALILESENEISAWQPA